MNALKSLLAEYDRLAEAASANSTDETEAAAQTAWEAFEILARQRPYRTMLGDLELAAEVRAS